MERTLLSAWENFYVIVGSAAAALTGLQFVVVALASDRGALKPAAARAFGTPTIVHFCAVLLISAILSAPWPGILGVRFALALCGLAGAAYGAYVIRHAARQSEYVPDLEDRIFHLVVPFVTYIGLLAASLCLRRFPMRALFGIAGLSLLLLLVGIHNAWDAVVYIATGQNDDHPKTNGQK